MWIDYSFDSIHKVGMSKTTRAWCVTRKLSLMNNEKHRQQERRITQAIDLNLWESVRLVSIHNEKYRNMVQVIEIEFSTRWIFLFSIAWWVRLFLNPRSPFLSPVSFTASQPLCVHCSFAKCILLRLKVINSTFRTLSTILYKYVS